MEKQKMFDQNSIELAANNIFQFECIDVRVVGTPEKLEWVAVDVGTALNISDSTLARRLREMPDSWKGGVNIDTPSGVQNFRTVSEPGLYDLIFCSRSDKSRKFQVWTFEKVLPAIRERGGIIANQQQYLATATAEELNSLQIQAIKEQAIREAANLLANPMELIEPLSHYIAGVRLVAKSILKEVDGHSSKHTCKTYQVLVCNSSTMLENLPGISLGSFSVNELFELMSVLCWMRSELPTVRHFGRSSIELFSKLPKHHFVILNGEHISVPQSPIYSLKEIADGKRDDLIRQSLIQWKLTSGRAFEQLRGMTDVAPLAS